jgi:hypothetical protein
VGKQVDGRWYDKSGWTNKTDIDRPKDPNPERLVDEFRVDSTKLVARCTDNRYSYSEILRPNFFFHVVVIRTNCMGCLATRTLVFSIHTAASSPLWIVGLLLLLLGTERY